MTYHCEGLDAYEHDGNLMINGIAVRISDAKELHVWLGRWLREKRQEVVQRELQIARDKPPQPMPESMPAPANLPVRHFVYDPPQDYPRLIGYRPGKLDLHRNVLTPSVFVSAEDAACTHTWAVGDIVEASEADPLLLRFLEGNRAFRRPLLRELEPH